MPRRENGKKYPLLVDSFNYFVGMAENAISYYNTILIDKNYRYVVGHKVIKWTDTVESLYNPLNITFDYKVRDIAEFIKYNFFNQIPHILYPPLLMFITCIKCHKKADEHCPCPKFMILHSTPPLFWSVKLVRYLFCDTLSRIVTFKFYYNTSSANLLRIFINNQKRAFHRPAIPLKFSFWIVCFVCHMWLALSNSSYTITDNSSFVNCFIDLFFHLL